MRNATRLISLILLLGSLSAASPAWAGHVTFFVNLALQGKSASLITGEAQRFAEMIYDNVSRHYPDSIFVAIEASSTDELNHALAEQVNEHTIVDSLIVMSHGDS